MRKQWHVCVGLLVAIPCATMVNASVTGFYGGMVASLDGGQMRIQSSANEGYHASLTGQDGGAALGWEWQSDRVGTDWHGRWAVEMSASSSNEQYKETNKRAVQLRSYRVTNDMGVSVLPGVSKGDQRYFGRVGWKSIDLQHNEDSVAAKRSPAFSEHPGAWVFGLGVEQLIDSHWSLRAELDRSSYKSIESSDILTYTQKLQRTQSTFSLLWHATAVNDFGSKSHYFKDGWHVGGALGADMAKAHLNAVDSNDDLHRSYALSGKNASVMVGRDWQHGRDLGLGVELSASAANAKNNFNSGSKVFGYSHDADIAVSAKPTWYSKFRHLSAFVEAGAAMSHVKKTGAVVASSHMPPNSSRWYPGYVVGVGTNMMVDAANAIGVRHRYIHTASHRQTDGESSYKSAYRAQVLAMTWTHYYG